MSLAAGKCKYISNDSDLDEHLGNKTKYLWHERCKKAAESFISL